MADKVNPDQSLTRLKECRYGKMMYLHRDKYIGRALDIYGEFSEGEAAFFSQIIRPKDVVIEIGANIGAHTVRLAQLVGPQGLVLAFEPQRILYHILCGNIALNNLFNVHTYLAAVGKEVGMLKVPPLDYAAEANFGGVSLEDVTAGEPIAVTTLDSLKLPYLRLLKVDVEGMESDVLFGARKLIAQHRPFLYVENDRREKSEALISFIDALGYDLWWHLPPLFNPDNYAHNDKNIFENLVSVNLFCAPKEIPTNVQELRKVSGPTDYWHYTNGPMN
jgi:FkbM family methyltransferase